MIALLILAIVRRAVTAREAVGSRNSSAACTVVTSEIPRGLEER
jgi:hypothetical protein